MAYLYRKSFLWALQALLVSVLFTGGAQAQTVPNLSSLVVEAELQKNAAVLVKQEITSQASFRLSWPVYSSVDQLKVTADGRELSSQAVRLKRQGNRTLVDASSDTAKQWVLSYHTTSQLIRATNRDQLYLQILNESGASIDSVQVTFKLPEEVAGEGLGGNVYAIGGVNQPRTNVINNRTLVYEGGFLGPKAIFTINAHWPKTVLKLTPSQELRLSLTNLEILPWVGIGVLLPLLSFLVLLRLIIRQRRSEPQVSEELDAPPAPLSPLIVGTLVDRKVFPKELVAMFIDLCHRGYIVIVKKSGEYYLSQRRVFDENLEPWEKDFLEAVFPYANTRLTKNEMQLLNRRSLFNPQVRQAFNLIYQVVTAKNFFAENPHVTRVRYKLFAMAIYFASVFGAAWVAVSGASPYLLLPLGGTMLVCRQILKYTPNLVRYTELGLDTKKNWLAFANYLKKAEPFSIEVARNRMFEKYLAYAISLDATEAWAKRFDISEIVIVKPDWFISYEETSTTEFALEIEKFSKSISEMVTEMRGPLVN